MICYNNKDLQSLTLELYKKYFYDLPTNLKTVKFSHMKDDGVLGYSHADLKPSKQLIDGVIESDITNEIYISNGYKGINCEATLLHEMCHSYVDTNFYEEENENNFNHKGLWLDIAEKISNRSGLNCLWDNNPDDKKVLAKDTIEKTLDKSRSLMEFFIKLNKDKNTRRIKVMMNEEDTNEYLQLLMEDNDSSSWKIYWSRLLEWENSNFEYWKTSDESWIEYIAYGNL